jgi:hypothetical protein
MKTYAIALRMFNELGEIGETIDYLNSSFPGLLDDNLHKYLTTKRDFSQEESQRVMLSVILAFKYFFEDETKRGENPFRDIYEKHGNQTERILRSKYTLTEEYLNSKEIDIEYALENDFLVEVKLVSFTSTEKELLIRSLKNRQDFSMAENIMADIIIDKIK